MLIKKCSLFAGISPFLMRCARLVLHTALISVLAISSVKAQSNSNLEPREGLESLIEELRVFHDQEVRKAVKESKQKLNEKPPSNYPNKVRADLEEYKKTRPYHRTTFELTMDRCLNGYTTISWNHWAALDLAKKKLSQDGYNGYEVIAEGIRSVKSTELGSPFRIWVDKVISNYEGGLSQDETTRAAFFECVRWANIDADAVLTDRVIDKDDLDRDVDRGSLQTPRN